MCVPKGAYWVLLVNDRLYPIKCSIGTEAEPPGQDAPIHMLLDNYVNDVVQKVEASLTLTRV